MPRKRKNILVSPLASVLAGILEAGVYNRAQWSDLCFVTSSAMSQWLSDATIPRPEVLRTLFHTITTTDGFSEKLIAEFRRVIELPAAEATPAHASKVGVSIRSYMLAPIRERFLASLNALPPSAQEQLLPKFMTECDQFDDARRSEGVAIGAPSTNQCAELSNDEINSLYVTLNSTEPSVTYEDVEDTCRRLVLERQTGSIEESALVIAEVLKQTDRPQMLYKHLKLIDQLIEKRYKNSRPPAQSALQ
jgi:hypothetical protein